MANAAGRNSAWRTLLGGTTLGGNAGATFAVGFHHVELGAKGPYRVMVLIIIMTMITDV